MKVAVHMVLTLMIIGILAGGSLSFVSNWADPLIVANKKLETEKAIFLVQPLGVSYERVNTKEIELYKVFDKEKAPIGYSLVYEGNGFQGKIRLIAGLDKDLKNMKSLEILEQVETPGLGSKITEDNYKGQFKNLLVSPDIEWVKGVSPSKPNEIQTITGATISSKSVVAILNEGIAKTRKILEEGSK